MDMNMFYGILIPFVGTSAGAACVFFMKKDLNQWVQRCLTGFAAGVMVAASVWSLLIPAIEQSGGMGSGNSGKRPFPLQRRQRLLRLYPDHRQGVPGAEGSGPGAAGHHRGVLHPG